MNKALHVVENSGLSILSIYVNTWIHYLHFSIQNLINLLGVQEVLVNLPLIFCQPAEQDLCGQNMFYFMKGPFLFKLNKLITSKA